MAATTAAPKLNRFYNRFDPFLLCMDIMVNDCRKA